MSSLDPKAKKALKGVLSDCFGQQAAAEANSSDTAESTDDESYTAGSVGDPPEEVPDTDEEDEATPPPKSAPKEEPPKPEPKKTPKPGRGGRRGGRGGGRGGRAGGTKAATPKPKPAPKAETAKKRAAEPKAAQPKRAKVAPPDVVAEAPGVVSESKPVLPLELANQDIKRRLELIKHNMNIVEAVAKSSAAVIDGI